MKQSAASTHLFRCRCAIQFVINWSRALAYTSSTTFERAPSLQVRVLAACSSRL
jgi:hypothetical protein